MAEPSAPETPVVTKELKVTQWLSPVDLIVPDKGPYGEPKTKVEQNMMLLVDPNNPRLSSQESRGSTPLKIPQNTPPGSYVAAVTLEKKATEPNEKDKKHVEVYRIGRSGNRFTAEKVSTSDGVGNVIADFAAEEIYVGTEQQQVSGGKNIRRATSETATAQALSKPREEHESHFWLLPSRSPYIEIGLVSTADVTSLRNSVQARLNASVRLNEMPKQAVSAAQPAG